MGLNCRTPGGEGYVLVSFHEFYNLTSQFNLKRLVPEVKLWVKLWPYNLTSLAGWLAAWPGRAGLAGSPRSLSTCAFSSAVRFLPRTLFAFTRRTWSRLVVSAVYFMVGAGERRVLVKQGRFLVEGEGLQVAAQVGAGSSRA